MGSFAGAVEPAIFCSFFSERSQICSLRVISFLFLSLLKNNISTINFLFPQQCGPSLSLSSQTTATTCYNRSPRCHSTTTHMLNPTSIIARRQDTLNDQSTLIRGIMTTRTCSDPSNTIHTTPVVGVAVVVATSQYQMDGREHRHPQLRGAVVVRILRHRESRPLGIGMHDSKVKDRVSSNKETRVQWRILLRND